MLIMIQFNAAPTIFHGLYNQINGSGFCGMLSMKIGPFIDASRCGSAENLSLLLTWKMMVAAGCLG